MNGNNHSPSAQNIYNPLEVMQPGEEVVCEIKRHPIGLLPAYLVSAILIVAAASAAILVPYYVDTLSQQEKLGLLLSSGLVAVATLLYVYIATMVYTANRWIITSDSLTQIAQSGLTTTESSQLSLDDLEDITVEQNGILQLFFGFGTLHAETAGERSKFVFPYCPNPDDYARKILGAREAFEAKEKGGDHESRP
jgi:hypothetical protein